MNFFLNKFVYKLSICFWILLSIGTNSMAHFSPERFRGDNRLVCAFNYEFWKIFDSIIKDFFVYVSQVRTTFAMVTYQLEVTLITFLSNF